MPSQTVCGDYEKNKTQILQWIRFGCIYFIKLDEEYTYKVCEIPS